MQDGYKLTIGLAALWLVTLGDLALILEVNVPAFRRALLVLQCECEDGTALLDGLFLLRRALVHRIVNEIEGLRGGKCWVGERHCVGVVRRMDARCAVVLGKCER
jgi:hypothetical protein